MKIKKLIVGIVFLNGFGLNVAAESVEQTVSDTSLSSLSLSTQQSSTMNLEKELTLDQLKKNFLTTHKEKQFFCKMNQQEFCYDVVHNEWEKIVSLPENLDYLVSLNNNNYSLDLSLIEEKAKEITSKLSILYGHLEGSSLGKNDLESCKTICQELCPLYKDLNVLLEPLRNKEGNNKKIDCNFLDSLARDFWIDRISASVNLEHLTPRQGQHLISTWLKPPYGPAIRPAIFRSHIEEMIKTAEASYLAEVESDRKQIEEFKAFLVSAEGRKDLSEIPHYESYYAVCSEALKTATPGKMRLFHFSNERMQIEILLSFKDFLNTFKNSENCKKLKSYKRLVRMGELALKRAVPGSILNANGYKDYFYESRKTIFKELYESYHQAIENNPLTLLLMLNQQPIYEQLAIEKPPKNALLKVNRWIDNYNFMQASESASSEFLTASSLSTSQSLPQDSSSHKTTPHPLLPNNNQLISGSSSASPQAISDNFNPAPDRFQEINSVVSSFLNAPLRKKVSTSTSPLTTIRIAGLLCANGIYHGAKRTGIYERFIGALVKTPKGRDMVEIFRGDFDQGSTWLTTNVTNKILSHIPTSLNNGLNVLAQQTPATYIGAGLGMFGLKCGADYVQQMYYKEPTKKSALLNGGGYALTAGTVGTLLTGLLSDKDTRKIALLGTAAVAGAAGVYGCYKEHTNISGDHLAIP